MGVERGAMVGREAEADALAAVVTACTGGQGDAVLIRGEAGIGKSHLLHHAVGCAEEEGVGTLCLRFARGEESVPLSAFRHVLDDWPAPGRGATRLAELVASTAPVDLRTQLVQAGIDAVMDLVRDGGPLLLAVEDLQWVDPQSIHVLRALARRTTSVPLAMVGTTRQPSAGDADGLVVGGRPVQELHLPPLAADHLDALTRRALGARPGPRLRTQLRRTGGNALLATELLAEITRSGVLVQGEGTVDVHPGATVMAPDLRVHVANRLQGLDAPARQVVVLVALADLTAVQLARLLDTTVAGTAVLVDQVVADGMVVADGVRLRLRHDLLRDAVLEQVPPAVRAGLHADLVRLFTAEDVEPGRLAVHLVGSGEAGEALEEVSLIADAGRRLISTAPSLAASLLRRARRAGVEGVEVDLASALILLGDVTGAEVALDGMDVAAGADARRALGQLDFLRGELRSASRRFEEVAADLVGPASRRALADAALSSLLVGQLDRAGRLALRAGVAHPDAGDRASAGTALLVRGWVAGLGGDLDRGVALARRGHQLSMAAPEGAADPNLPDFFLAQVLAWAERGEEAAVALERGLARAAERSMAWHRASLHALHADINLHGLRWHAAEASLAQALAHAGDLEVEHGLPWCLAVQAHMDLARGRDVAAVLRRAEAATGRLGGQSADLVLWMRGLAHLAGGRDAEAVQVLGFLWGRLEAVGTALRQVHIAPDLVRAAMRTDTERAVAVEQWLDVVASGRAWPRASAVRDHARGLLAGDADRVSAAAVALEALGDPMTAARMWVDAALLDRDGTVGRAAAEHARRLLEPVGADAWLAPLGVHDDGPADDGGWADLTPAQARIVHRVGLGLSNTEIAEALEISRRTVESHLHHAYAKLDVRSRVQLGLRAAERIREGWQPPG